jgi:D(-)-tartrate dehydratase
VRIVAINEAAMPVRSAMRNAVFSFADMTTSVIAVVTDAIRDGKPVVGYAFNSTGRYACGAQTRARFIPRLLSADPAALLDFSACRCARQGASSSRNCASVLMTSAGS